MAALVGSCASGEDRPADVSVTVDCTVAIASEEALPNTYGGVGDLVGLPAEDTELRSGPRRSSDGEYRFAKIGIMVEASADVSVAVRPHIGLRAYLDYGAGDELGEPGVGHAIHFPRCASATRWLVFAGGVWVPEGTDCVELIIESPQRTYETALGTESACAG